MPLGDDSKILNVISIPLIPADSVHRERLANGLTLLVRRDDSAPAVAIVTYVVAGYFDEPDEVAGISHVLEHMFFKGTPTFGVGEISRATKAAGGYLNAGTTYDHTSYYTVLPSSGFSRGLEIQADAYANSVIDADELRRELEVIIQEARRKADSPGAVATESMYALLFDRHRMKRWRIGTEPVLRSLTRERVMDFYRRYYVPSNTILSIVGDVDVERVIREVERCYGSLADTAVRRDRGPRENGSGGFRYREMAGDIAQTRLALGWKSPGSGHEDTCLLDLASTVLGAGRASRLYRAARERQLVSSVAAYNHTPTDVGAFTIPAEGPPELAMEAARAIWAQVREIREGGVGKDELWRARRIFEARWIRRLETAEGQANYLAEWQAEGDWTLGDRYLERLLVATEDQVTDAARRYLAEDQCSVLLYRPREAPPAAEDRDEFLHALQSSPPAALPVSPPREASAPAIISDRPALDAVVAGVHVYRTRHGVPILVRQKGGAPLVHAGIFAAGGAVAEEASLAGLTHLLTRTAIKGTARRNAAQIAEDAELLGGSIGTSASSESLGWSLSVPAARMDAALELLSDVAQHPTFPEAALATERSIAEADLRHMRDDMSRYPMRLLMQTAYAGHPYGIPVSGTEESLAAITAGEMRQWHESQVRNGASVIAIAGAVSPDEAAACAARCFAELRMRCADPVQVPEWPRVARAGIEHRDKEQTAIALAFEGPSRSSEERFAAELMAGVASGLGGRFFEELRDRRSLAYSVHAYPVERSTAGMFVSYIATSPEREDEARDGILAEFERFRQAPVTSDELERAKEYAVGTHAIRQGSGAAVLGDVIEAWLFGSLDELVSYDSRMRAVTAGEMRELASKWFDPDRVVQGIVRGKPRAATAR